MDLSKIVDLNFETLLPEIHALIQQWNRRILTPIGETVKTKFFFFKNINTNNITPTSIVKWNSFLLLKGNEEITSQNVFKLCFRLTTDSTIQWFLHRILPVKNYLKK